MLPHPRATLLWGLLGLLAVGSAGDGRGLGASERAGTPSAKEAAKEALAGVDAAIEAGRLEEALSLAERAIAADPRNGHAHNVRVVALAALGRYEEARRALERLADLVPLRAVDTGALALSYYGDLEGARYLLERCVDELQPRNPFCWVQLVQVHLARGEEEAALRRAREAFERAKPGEVLDRLFRVLWDQVLFEHDKKRIERGLGRPLPPRGGPDAQRMPLPVPRRPGTTVSVPIAIQDGWPLVAVEIEGRIGRLILDSGADHIQVTAAFARKAGLKKVGDVDLVAGGGRGLRREEFAVARLARIGGLTFENVPVQVGAPPPTACDGVIGTALLGGFLVDLDFPGRRLRLAPADLEVEKAFPDLPRGTVRVQTIVVGHLVRLPVGIGPELRGWFLLDTGANTSLANLGALPRLEREAGVRVLPPPKGEKQLLVRDAAGQQKGAYLSPVSVTVGPFASHFSGMIGVSLSHAELGVSLLGAFGMDVLRDYRVVLDYGRRRAYLWWKGARQAEFPPGIVALDLPEPDLASRLGLSPR